MKKFLSLFLVLAMTLSMLTIPTFAATVGDQTTTATPTTTTVVTEITGDTVEYDGKTYNVIKTAEQFKAMTSGNNYILANDIDFGEEVLGANIISTAGGVLLNGNGYSVTFEINNVSAGQGIFTRLNAGVEFVIKNITFNVSGVLNQNSTAVLLGTSNGHYLDTTATFENVIMNCDDLQYVDQNAARGAGLFYAKIRTNATFKNCLLTGTFTATGASVNMGVGGYVGLIDFNKTGGKVVFENCKATGTYNFTNSSSNSHSPFVGYMNSAAATVEFNNCEADVTINAKGSRVGAFVGQQNNGVVTYKDCTAKGTYTFGNIQSGCYAGHIQGTGSATFTNCTANATVLASANRASFFVGQTFNNNAYTFTSCKASGLFVSSSTWSGAFMGVAGGSYNGDAKTATVTFNGCDTDVVMFGQGSVAAYVGANGGGKPTVNFNDCTSSATIYSMGSASAWIAEINHEETVVNHSGSNSTTVVNSATFVAGDENDDFPTWNTVSAEALADGSYAYAVAEAQKAAGVADAYLFGQNIGTDAQPKVGGATVNKVVTTYAGTVYTNATGTETVASNSGNAKAYFQTATAGENLLKTRVIVAMSKANLDKIAAMEIKVTFTLADTTTKTLTLNKWDVDCYYSVYADNKIAEAEDGCVLLAITVKDIPTDQWAGTEGTVAITMTATDADGNVLPEYTLA